MHTPLLEQLDKHPDKSPVYSVKILFIWFPALFKLNKEDRFEFKLFESEDHVANLEVDSITVDKYDVGWVSARFVVVYCTLVTVVDVSDLFKVLMMY